MKLSQHIRAYSVTVSVPETTAHAVRDLGCISSFHGSDLPTSGKPSSGQAQPSGFGIAKPSTDMLRALPTLPVSGNQEATV